MVVSVICSQYGEEKEMAWQVFFIEESAYPLEDVLKVAKACESRRQETTEWMILRVSTMGLTKGFPH